ncbi:MAG: hypothetical protein ACJ8FV_15635, partial [Xanthobacteraceae bacterium]
HTLATRYFVTYLQRPLTIIFATAFSPKKAAFAEAFIQVFTLDLRFHDTDLSKQECFVLHRRPARPARRRRPARHVAVVRQRLHRQGVVRSHLADQPEALATWVGAAAGGGSTNRRPFHFVVIGLVPAIHVFAFVRPWPGRA